MLTFCCIISVSLNVDKLAKDDSKSKTPVGGGLILAIACKFWSIYELDLHAVVANGSTPSRQEQGESHRPKKDATHKYYHRMAGASRAKLGAPPGRIYGCPNAGAED